MGRGQRGLSDSVVMVDVDAVEGREGGGDAKGGAGRTLEWKGERMVDSGPLHRLQVCECSEVCLGIDVGLFWRRRRSVLAQT